MTYPESPSPARRPQLAERSASTNSLSRASPSTGKGSTTKLHKAHPVRHPHGRVLSHGRNLNKLVKLTTTQPPEEHTRSKEQSKNKARTLSTSPSTAPPKQNSSKVSVKRNASNLSQKRNSSASKLGNATRVSRGDGVGLGETSHARARFSIGSDGADDEWTAADHSQSPSAMTRSSHDEGLARPERPQSPEQLRPQSPKHFPASSPLSPSSNGGLVHNDSDAAKQCREPNGLQSRPAQAVTSRLLSRNTSSNAKPQTSAVSATVTPSSADGSPALNYSQDSTLRHDQSMPADGISRFMNATGSSSESGTLHSDSHVHSTIAASQREERYRDTGQSETSVTEPTAAVEQGRRTRSTTGIPNGRREERVSLPPPSSPTQPSTQSANKIPQPSPFTSAREHQSMTQLKLDLQRISANREPAHAPAIQPPLSSAHASLANLSLHGSEWSIHERKQRSWAQAETEYRNGRRFVGVVTKGLERLEKRDKFRGQQDGKNEGKERDGGRKRDGKALISTSVESRPDSRGRVRFEIGGGHGDERTEADTDSDGGGLEGLLRRTWEGDGQSGGDD
ncbi:MAG: hypothetical protein Q9174_000273 [Haloplaca sp. 1 TL-2023]